MTTSTASSPSSSPAPSTSEATVRHDTPGRPGSVAPLRRDDFDRDVWCVLGLPIDRHDVTRAVGEVEAAVRDGRRLSFVTPNVNWLARAVEDPSSRAQIVDADMSVADGAPLVMAAKLLGAPITSRTAGSDMFDMMRRRANPAGRRLKVYFFGGRDGAAQAAVAAINAERGGVEAVGWCNPGFGDVAEMSTDEIIADINRAAPDFVMVALGAQKGQAWIEHNQDRLSAPVLAHLGAVVDFAAGGIARAPAFSRRAGLEWAWRIKEEPGLWRRYAKDGLALTKILATRLAPMLFTRTLARRAGGAGEAGAVLTRAGDRITISLSGDLVDGRLSEVIGAFREAANGGVDVVLNFEEVSGLDLRFLGLVLMLEKNLRRTNATILVQGAGDRERRALKANGLNYKSAPASEASVAENARAAAQ